MNSNKKIDNIFQAVIQGLSHDGRGLTHINNKITFIPGTMPGDTVTLKIIQKRNTYNEASLINIIQPSIERAAPPCQHFAICGGCSLQHLSMDAQIIFKNNTLLEQLKHFGNITPETILTPLTVNSIGYRRKARLGVKYVFKKNKLLMGFHEKSSSYVADLEQCIILHPLINKHFQALQSLIASLTTYQTIPQIEVAMGDDDVAFVIRHLVPLPSNDKFKMIDFAKTHNINIYLQPNPPSPIQKCWPDNEYHRLTYSLPDYDLELLFHPLDFTQINLEINRLMIKQVLHYLDLKKDDNVLDLFCGIGNFSLPMAKYACKVVGIEGSKDMVSRAVENAKHNNIENALFYTANLMLPLENSNWMQFNYDKILLDPPRAGAKEILPFIPKWNAKKIVYVSCNPATLARDAGELSQRYGYQLKQIGIMNMFPHTSHIEAMAIFEKI